MRTTPSLFRQEKVLYRILSYVRDRGSITPQRSQVLWTVEKEQNAKQTHYVVCFQRI
jgi:hypothetical protein